MASGQFPSGPSAAASKFSLVDPLASGAPDEEKSIQEAVTAEVNSRMGAAVEDLKGKYERSGKGYEAAHDNRPTGLAYQREREEKQKRVAAIRAQERELESAAQSDDAELARQLQQSKLAAAAESDDDSDGYGDDDPELEKIRQARLAQLKAAHSAKSENLAKGHGRYREISQDEFLPEVTGSARVACHFYHNDFERCKIMDMHLGRLAPAHIECKFIKINAEKAPFFVQKLGVKVLPCVVLFKDGIATARIEGFEGLNEGQGLGKEDEWPTGNLAKRLALAKAIDYTTADTMDQLRKAHTNRIIREGLGAADGGGADLSDED